MKNMNNDRLRMHNGRFISAKLVKLVFALDVVDVVMEENQPMWSRPVLEYNGAKGKRWPYVQFTFFGYWIQIGWVFEEIPPAPPQVCGFVPPTPGYAGCPREKGHSGPCAHAFARPKGSYPKRSWLLTVRPTAFWINRIRTLCPLDAQNWRTPFRGSGLSFISSAIFTEATA